GEGDVDGEDRGVDPARPQLRQVHLPVPAQLLGMEAPAQVADGPLQSGESRRWLAAEAQVAAADVGDDGVVVRVDHQGVTMELAGVVGGHVEGRSKKARGKNVMLRRAALIL